VIEILQVHVPTDWNKTFSLVLGMATDALLLIGSSLDQCGVQSFMFRQSLPDISVAVQALKLSCARGDSVA
jgi:hypothetical protein